MIDYTFIKTATNSYIDLHPYLNWAKTFWAIRHTSTSTKICTISIYSTNLKPEFGSDILTIYYIYKITALALW